MSWWEAVPTLGLAIVVFVVPGLALLIASGVRGLNLAALSVPTTATIVACGGVAFGVLRIPFNPLTILALTLVLVCVALGARVLIRRRQLAAAGAGLHDSASEAVREANPRLLRWLIPLAVAVPAIIIAARYMNGFGTPESFSETFDNIYHLNAIRYIAETQSANSLSIGNLTDSSKALYPVGMHAMVALVYMMGAPSIMVALNWSTIIFAALVWPISCIFLMSRIIGFRPFGLLTAGVLSAGFSSFPYLMVAFGILYPNHAALTMLPAVLGLLIEATNITSEKLRIHIPAFLALLVTVPGLSLTHPSALVALLMFGCPVALALLLRILKRARARELSVRQLVLWLGLIAAYFVVTLGLWIVARPPASAASWAPIQSNADAVGEVLTSAPMGTTVAWILFLLTLAGLYTIARNFRTMWWILLMYVIAATLFLIVSAWPPGQFRFFMTGVWYSDSNRFAAMLPMATLPIVVIGAEAIILKVIEWGRGLKTSQASLEAAGDPVGAPLARLVQKLSPRTLTAVSTVLLVVLGVATQGGSLAPVQEKLTTTFLTKSDTSLVNSDELALLKQLDQLVPEGDMIVGNPRTGASLAFAFSGRRVVAPHILGARSDDERLLMDHWSEAAYNVAVCPVIKEKRAYWGLDFADAEMVPRSEPLEGTRDLADDSAPGVKLVKAVGSARLFKMTACG